MSMTINEDEKRDYIGEAEKNRQIAESEAAKAMVEASLKTSLGYYMKVMNALEEAMK